MYPARPAPSGMRRNSRSRYRRILPVPIAGLLHIQRVVTGSCECGARPVGVWFQRAVTDSGLRPPNESCGRVECTRAPITGLCLPSRGGHKRSAGYRRFPFTGRQLVGKEVVRLEPVARSKKNCELLLAGTLIRGDDAALWSIDLHHSAIPPNRRRRSFPTSIPYSAGRNTPRTHPSLVSPWFSRSRKSQLRLR
jgi:hypothetical protein